MAGSQPAYVLVLALETQITIWWCLQDAWRHCRRKFFKANLRSFMSQCQAAEFTAPDMVRHVTWVNCCSNTAELYSELQHALILDLAA